MRVKVTCLGCINKPVDKFSRWFWIYFLEAENGLVDTSEEEDLIEDGVYELPDKDWEI